MKKQFFKMSMAIIFSMIFFGQANAQRGNYRMIDSIPEITKDQKIKIATIHETQRIEMGELRQQRQNAKSWDEKDKIDRQMLDKHIEFRNSVRNLLNDDQKKYFDQHFDQKFTSGKGNHNRGNYHGNKQCCMR
jgi:hypothetical protein